MSGGRNDALESNTAHSAYAVIGLVRERYPFARLVAIDGVAGAGKSALGAQLATAFDGALHIDLDKFLVPKADKFVAALRLDELTEALRVPARKFVSGICMIRVLEAVGVRADALIYVKRMRRWGWADEDEADGDDLEKHAATVGLTPEWFPLPLEVRNYHRSYEPHRRADIVFERLDLN